MQMQFPILDIDCDSIAILHNCNWTAFCRLRRNMTNRTTIIHAGKPTICNKCNTILQMVTLHQF